MSISTVQNRLYRTANDQYDTDVSIEAVFIISAYVTYDLETPPTPETRLKSTRLSVIITVLRRFCCCRVIDWHLILKISLVRRPSRIVS